MSQLSQTMKIVPLLEPKSGSTATQLKSGYVNAGAGHWISFVVPFAAITVGATLTVESAVESTGATVNVPFTYRISAAVGSEGFGAVSKAAADTGAAIAGDDDNKVVIAEVSPSSIYAVNPAASLVRAAITFGAGAGATVGGVQAFIESRYPSA